MIDKIYQNYFGKKLILPTEVFSKWEIAKRLFYLAMGRGLLPMSGKKERMFCKQIIGFYRGMGYDYVPDLVPGLYVVFMIRSKTRVGEDTAQLSRGQRWWVEEGKGIITSWEDFEKFRWDRLKVNFELWTKFWEENIPPGMKITEMGNLYELVQEHFMGYEGLFTALAEQPDLVEAVFNRVGQVLYDFYQGAVKCKALGAIWHADDLGYKTGTMISPNQLRKYLFPWMKKYAELAHSHGKMFWMHSCGKTEKVLEDLINDVKIDAYHSFQDEIIPVAEFKKIYGNRIGVLGGVDVDNLARMEEKQLREYCRKILDQCMPGGRYAFGSGNSVANYIPVKNYLIMLDEARKWRA